METWAKVTPFILHLGGTACPVWLDHHLQRQGARSPFFRWEMRNRLLARLGDAHGRMAAPRIEDLGSVPGGLLPEQEWFYRRFAETYCETFADEPGEKRPHGCESASDFRRRQLHISGAVDLLLTLPDGRAELRQLELWGGQLCADPYESWEIGLAVLRLASANRDLSELTVCHADLLSGVVERRHLVIAEHLRSIADSLDEHVGDLRSRASSPVAVPGRSCGRCDIALGCDAWADRPKARPVVADPARTDYVGPIVRLTPTSIERWLDCPRAYRAADLLDLPTGRGSPRSSQGITVHARLAGLHEGGPCGADLVRQEEAASADGVVDQSIMGFIARHARRCPQSATSVGHELDLAQLHTCGEVPVMVTGRIDAIWEHNGLLDCRDYKTGMPRAERVADIPAAKLQAWLLAPIAAARGLQLRLSYEHLAEDTQEDPESYEPDEEDLAEIRRWIGEIGAEIARSEFRGVREAHICRRCTFQRACPDAAFDDDEDEDGDGANGFMLRVVDRRNAEAGEPVDRDVRTPLRRQRSDRRTRETRGSEVDKPVVGFRGARG